MFYFNIKAKKWDHPPGTDQTQVVQNPQESVRHQEVTEKDTAVAAVTNALVVESAAPQSVVQAPITLVVPNQYKNPPNYS